MITLRVSIVFAGVLITIIALVTYALLLLKRCYARARGDVSRARLRQPGWFRPTAGAKSLSSTSRSRNQKYGSRGMYRILI
jgi:hypothetical protein